MTASRDQALVVSLSFKHASNNGMWIRTWTLTRLARRYDTPPCRGHRGPAARYWQRGRVWMATSVHGRRGRRGWLVKTQRPPRNRAVRSRELADVRVARGK